MIVDKTTDPGKYIWKQFYEELQKFVDVLESGPKPA